MLFSVTFSEYCGLDRSIMAHNARSAFGTVADRSSTTQVLAGRRVLAADAGVRQRRIEVEVLAGQRCVAV